VPFQDALMAVIAIKLKFSIWSKDKNYTGGTCRKEKRQSGNCFFSKK
jgi:hypothetical protein